ncbi:hypothetical protein PsorP6_002636 [Peronosclerospora sorghi]|uniref:Uncharacterized protein n=1 Tax=Peronosclerospora sorghi TaxID=230839 RepID=A0ACC0WPQ7_9STRA|nr:hypothetical protein PsorP6_002636 [Peronosclerospora sorghi]
MRLSKPVGRMKRSSTGTQESGACWRIHDTRSRCLHLPQFYKLALALKDWPASSISFRSIRYTSHSENNPPQKLFTTALTWSDDGFLDRCMWRTQRFWLGEYPLPPSRDESYSGYHFPTNVCGWMAQRFYKGHALCVSVFTAKV